MIIGCGVDILELDRIRAVVQKNPDFAKKVLTKQEFDKYQTLVEKRKIEYLAGRFAAKEAFSKALGTGIGKVGMQDIEILNAPNGRPYISSSPFKGNQHISISHSGSDVIAQVILERGKISICLQVLIDQVKSLFRKTQSHTTCVKKKND